MVGILFILCVFSKDKRKSKYYQDILKKHKYWDNKPMLRDDR